MNDILHDLSALVHEDQDKDSRSAMAWLFSSEIFLPQEGLTHIERCRSTYARMRFANDHLPPATALLKDPRVLLAVLETAAVADPSVFLAMTIHYCLGVTAILEFGAGRDDLAPYRDELDAMSSFATLVVTELGHGNSHSALRTEARYEPETTEFVLHTPDPGARKFMSNNALTGVAKIGVVYARLLIGDADHGIFPFITRLQETGATPPGVRISPLPETPMVPLDYAVIEFDHVRLPKHALLHDNAKLDDDGTFTEPLGRPDARLRRSLTVRENAWVASAAALAAVSRAGVTIAVRHAHHRLTRARYSAEKPVLRFRTQQQALFGALAATYATTCLVNRAKRAWIDIKTGGAPHTAEWAPGPLGRSLGLVKAAACSTAERVNRDCGLRSGAHGMFSANRLVDYHGLAHILNPAAGDSHLIVLDAGRALAEGEHYQPPSPVTPTGRKLDDPALWLDLVATRERRLHDELTAGLRRAQRRGQDPFEAWNNRLPLALDLAGTHIHRLELTCFIEAVEAVTDRGARTALDPLVTLYALETARADLAWYLTNGLVTTEQAHALPTLLNLACEKLLPHAHILVDAFDLTEELLHAPINGVDYPDGYRNPLRG
jgi:acyl-CoA oxidase